MATDGTDELRCAPWTLGQGIDPIGSAVPIDTLIAVEIPLPWPSDVGETAWLRDLPDVEGIRLQAIVPETARPDGSVLVTRWRRVGARYEGDDWLIAPVDVRRRVEGLIEGQALPDPTPAPPDVLICGHGSRDRCCGGAGTRLAVEARAALGHVRVRRTSHLGGHRFAPTALVLPEGRAWAYLDADLLVAIVDRTLPAEVARRHYRGAAALSPWAQVVEGARFSALGWGAMAAEDLRAEIVDHDDHADVTLEWTDEDGSGETTASVHVRRRYPVLVCGAPPEDATKTAVEYEIRSETPRTADQPDPRSML